MTHPISGTEVLEVFLAIDDLRPSGADPRADAAQVAEDETAWSQWVTALASTYTTAELERFHRTTGETSEAARPGFFSRTFRSSQRRTEDIAIHHDARAYHRLTADALATHE